MTQQTPENIPILGETGWFYTEFTGPGVAPTKGRQPGTPNKEESAPRRRG